MWLSLQISSSIRRELKQRGLQLFLFKSLKISLNKLNSSSQNRSYPSLLIVFLACKDSVIAFICQHQEGWASLMVENENARTNEWSLKTRLRMSTINREKVETSQSRKIGKTLSLMVWAHEEAVDRSCKITKCLKG